MKCSAKEAKGYKMFNKSVKMISKRGKMLWNVQQKRENAMKCSAKEAKGYKMFNKSVKMISKRGKMLWNV